MNEVNELNREQVIKALKCCGGIINDCRECPIDEKKKDDCGCSTFLAQKALSLIKELIEENTEVKTNWQKLKESHESACEECRAEFNRLTEENEKVITDLMREGEMYLKQREALQCQVNRLKKYDKERDIALHARLISETRADTVRKMQDRLKAHFDTYTDEDETNAVYMRNLIDQIAKEMLEVAS